MKKTIFTLLVILISICSNAQENQKTTTKKKHYSVLWGTIKSKDYPKKVKTGTNNLVVKSKMADLKKTDTTKYEEKSILGGAVKWTKKKPKSTIKQ
jgi:hypothetical protein